MRIVVWLARAFLFFVLFAFALNNQHDAAIRWFFGYEWHTSMVFVVLAAFALGCAAGVLAMLPSWWRHRRGARRRATPEAETVADTSQLVLPSTPEHPPRDGI
ncbi:MAG: LapA family protein [Piscinibacter sp.]|nr:LapA family protein [Piscinibacter sp.]